jgi:hypothetical protein
MFDATEERRKTELARKRVKLRSQDQAEIGGIKARTTARQAVQRKMEREMNAAYRADGVRAKREREAATAKEAEEAEIRKSNKPPTGRLSRQEAMMAKEMAEALRPGNAHFIAELSGRPAAERTAYAGRKLRRKTARPERRRGIQSTHAAKFRVQERLASNQKILQTGHLWEDASGKLKKTRFKGMLRQPKASSRRRTSYSTLPIY